MFLGKFHVVSSVFKNAVINILSGSSRQIECQFVLDGYSGVTQTVDIVHADVEMEHGWTDRGRMWMRYNSLKATKQQGTQEQTEHIM